MERLTKHRRFVLIRAEDISGVSGVGIVAHGVDFGNKTVLYWLGDHNTLGVYDSIESLLAIHGHEGRTWAEWLDDEGGEPPNKDREKPGLLGKLAGAVRALAGRTNK